MKPGIISDNDFHALITKRTETLLGLVNYLSKCESTEKILTRPLLGELHSQATQLEELLDSYDARNNCRWCAYRDKTAALKLFSNISYELLHIQHSLPAYRLMPIEGDFKKATDQILLFMGGILRKISARMLLKAAALELHIPEHSTREQYYNEQLPPGRLPHNCAARRDETAKERVTQLATAFLNLARESADIRAAAKAKPAEYTLCAVATVTEERLRNLELRFHNLQSQYDTFVAGTEDERSDEELPVLRGHISVVFHLLTTATLFSHYYERHVNKKPCAMATYEEPLVDADTLLGVLMDYSIEHISLYIGCAEKLCENILERYADIEEIDVPVPQYRGFHVRPSALVSKLVLHYGSKINMHLAGEIYDASSPLELFRANERINAQKRKWLATEIDRLQIVPVRLNSQMPAEILNKVVSTLAERSKLVLYEHPLELPQLLPKGEGSLLQKINDIMTHLLAIGKIDIGTDLKATFIGDKRALEDIKLLAEYGYGEDNLGNNVALPEKLQYLRK